MQKLNDIFLGQSILIAQQEGLLILIVMMCILLGMVVLVIPRPRKHYLTVTEQRDAKLRKVRRKRPAAAAIRSPSSQSPQRPRG